MRIVSRKEFLTMPDGTVFMKFAKQPKDGKCKHLYEEGNLCIKDGTLGSDFIYQDTFPEFEGKSEKTRVMESMLEGRDSPSLDYYCSERDGLYDDDELFLVWSRDDLSELIQRLILAREEGYY